MTCNHEWGGVVIPGPVNRIVVDQCESCGELRLPDAPPAQAVDLPYSLDSDPAGIRAKVADSITGTLMLGAQGHTPPPAGHWLELFWTMARAEAAAQAVDLGQQKDAARYRWVRNHYDPSIHDGDDDVSFFHIAGDELDAAIDDLIDSGKAVQS